jgi:hypothetical protein
MQWRILMPLGLVASLNRPGGNVAGVELLDQELGSTTAITATGGTQSNFDWLFC